MWITFLDQPVKNCMRTYFNIWKIKTGQDDYTSGCLVDYHYFKEQAKSRGSEQGNIWVSQGWLKTKTKNGLQCLGASNLSN